jgi:hypothetical protein
MTYCIIWQQSCVVIQNKPPILPAFHNICPLAQWALHRSHRNKNNYGQLPQTWKFLMCWIRQSHITSRRTTRHWTEHRTSNMGQGWQLRSTASTTEARHPCSTTLTEWPLVPSTEMHFTWEWHSFELSFTLMNSPLIFQLEILTISTSRYDFNWTVHIYHSQGSTNFQKISESLPNTKRHNVTNFNFWGLAVLEWPVIWRFLLGTCELVHIFYM